MKINFVEPALPKTGSLVVGILEDRELTPTAADVDRQCGGALKRAMEFSRFRGKREQTLDVLVPQGLAIGRIVLLGLGKAAELDEGKAEAAGGVAVAHLNRVGEKTATIAIDKLTGSKLAAAAIAARVALGATLRAYRFDKYKTKEEKDKKPTLTNLHVAVADQAGAERAYRPLEKVAEGVFFTRDLVSEPANIIYPETLAKAAKKLEKLGVDVEVLDEKQMAKLGMGALIGVGQGSARPPRLVIMQWHGAAKSKKPVAFIGKGITFDTGGISIKPAANMEDMKWDMGGSGVVIGLMRALAGRKAKVNAIGVVALAENMPSGTAQRPGDIVTSMSGQTIEVINTDAEGRLVLADALWYTQDRFKPQFMVDLATLTGAIIISLGSEHAGLFSNDDKLAERLSAAGKETGELLWRLPLAEAYDKDINSDAADMKNVGSGRGAGSITAAQFLQRFVNKVPWAHLDIAGTTWSKKDTATVPKGATAFGLRLLDRFVQEHYEGK
jgi:leucyl aminopeptidase